MHYKGNHFALRLLSSYLENITISTIFLLFVLADLFYPRVKRRGLHYKTKLVITKWFSLSQLFVLKKFDCNHEVCLFSKLFLRILKSKNFIEKKTLPIKVIKQKNRFLKKNVNCMREKRVQKTRYKVNNFYFYYKERKLISFEF